jgi:hypothetical protein
LFVSCDIITVLPLLLIIQSACSLKTGEGTFSLVVGQAFSCLLVSLAFLLVSSSASFAQGWRLFVWSFLLLNAMIHSSLAYSREKNITCLLSF